jgi:multicomponent Na+:H+ antiporter subunit B
MTERETTVISRTVTRTVVPLILLTAFALLLQGHNLPGGGFIAGVLTTTAFALIYIIYGQEYLQEDLLGTAPTDSEQDLIGAVTTDSEMFSGITGVYAWLFALGLLLAFGEGVAAMVFGMPFLTQGVVFFKHVPIYGDFEIASALGFDLGVYLVVVGGLLTILAVVGRE